ncbi:MAG: hypothetical protein ACOYNN_19240, partial [Terrimicrobiaceae bacterium]
RPGAVVREPLRRLIRRDVLPGQGVLQVFPWSGGLPVVLSADRPGLLITLNALTFRSDRLIRHPPRRHLSTPFPGDFVRPFLRSPAP